jgi:integrase
MKEPISADMLRIRPGVGATRARLLVKIVLAEFEERSAAQLPAGEMLDEAQKAAVSRLNKAVLREVLEVMSLKLDGKQAAAKTVNRKRAVLFNTLEYAHELKLLTASRLSEVKWTAPKSVRAIDKRVVINPQQAKRLLSEVGAQRIESQPRRSSGPMLVAFFAVMYYAALRPEEAAMLRKSDLQLPEEGWGELLLSETAPITGAAWTDSGERRDRRQLKQRGKGEVRTVPSPPPLTAILRTHLTTLGTAADGRLFRNLTGGDLAESTIGRVWDRARKGALSEDEYGSPLAKRPYDLRHAVCRPGWPLGCRLRSARSGPAIPSRCCTRSTPRSSPDWSRPPTIASRRLSAGRADSLELCAK